MHSIHVYRVRDGHAAGPHEEIRGGDPVLPGTGDG